MQIEKLIKLRSFNTPLVNSDTLQKIELTSNMLLP